MIAEPYICTKGQRAGEITSMLSPKSLCSGSCSEPCVHCGWQRYADFEREKLKELGLSGVQYSSNGRAYEIGEHCSVMIGYASHEYENDSESGRLLKRAKFLKYVCEKEGVEWLPKEKCKCEGMKSYHAPIGECCEGVCPCPCHQEEKAEDICAGGRMHCEFSIGNKVTEDVKCTEVMEVIEDPIYFPNLTVPKMCGKPCNDGIICDDCRKRLTPKDELPEEPKPWHLASCKMCQDYPQAGGCKSCGGIPFDLYDNTKIEYPRFCSGKKEKEHEFETNLCGGSQCKNCGVWESVPQWSPFCSKKEKEPKPECGCTERFACCWGHAGKRGFLESDPKALMAESKPKEQEKCDGNLTDTFNEICANAKEASRKYNEESQSCTPMEAATAQTKGSLSYEMHWILEIVQHIHTFKAEEKEFRTDLLRSLELEAKFKPAKIPKIREGWIESLREKYL